MVQAIQLHLVGGFLGSGKTTAIAQAAGILIARGQRVGIITNEQGRHLVDTALFQAQAMPALEVTGGCICCHLDDFAERIGEMVAQFDPQVIFAESVGSCTDLVATVIKPLQALQKNFGSPASLSVFADARLLLRYLRGLEMPFSEGVMYIYGSQLEEAGLIVINKADLLSQKDLNDVLHLAGKAYPGKAIRAQNSFDRSQVADWLGIISSSASPLPQVSLDLDYDRYADGEGRFAWVDRELVVTLTAPADQHAILTFLEEMATDLASLKMPVAHLKCLVSDGHQSIKFSLTGADEAHTVFSPDTTAITLLNGKKFKIIINAMVEGDLKRVEACLDSTWRDFSAQDGVNVELAAAFTRVPGYPKPTMRIGNPI